MNTIQDFKDYVSSVESTPGYKKPVAFGLGIRKKKSDITLEVFYPHINYSTAYGTAAVIHAATNYGKYESGYEIISKAALEQALEKFKPFNDGKDHPNIDLIRTLSEAPQDLNTYHETDIILSLIHI